MRVLAVTNALMLVSFVAARPTPWNIDRTIVTNYCAVTDMAPEPGPLHVEHNLRTIHKIFERKKDACDPDGAHTELIEVKRCVRVIKRERKRLEKLLAVADHARLAHKRTAMKTSQEFWEALKKYEDKDREYREAYIGHTFMITSKTDNNTYAVKPIKRNATSSNLSRFSINSSVNSTTSTSLENGLTKLIPRVTDSLPDPASRGAESDLTGADACDANVIDDDNGTDWNASPLNSDATDVDKVAEVGTTPFDFTGL